MIQGFGAFFSLRAADYNNSYEFSKLLQIHSFEKGPKHQLHVIDELNPLSVRLVMSEPYNTR